MCLILPAPVKFSDVKTGPLCIAGNDCDPSEQPASIASAVQTLRQRPRSDGVIRATDAGPYGAIAIAEGPSMPWVMERNGALPLAP